MHTQFSTVYGTQKKKETESEWIKTDQHSTQKSKRSSYTSLCGWTELQVPGGRPLTLASRRPQCRELRKAWKGLRAFSPSKKQLINKSCFYKQLHCWLKFPCECGRAYDLKRSQRLSA